MPYETGKVFHVTRNGVKYGASQGDIARALAYHLVCLAIL